MQPLKPTFNCAYEDLPAIGSFVRASYVRDQADLATRSIKYKGSDFLTAYDAALLAVNNLVNPATFTAEHKKLTTQMATDAVAIRPLLNNLDIRLDDAADLALDAPTGPQLTVAPADFGLKALRIAINIHDAEAIAARGKDLLQLLTANAPALTAVEYPAPEQAQLEALLDSLTTANTAQNALISTRDAKVQTNMGVLNDFYTRFLGRLLRDGKKAYKEADAAKTTDYTFAQLKARVAPPTPAKKPAPTT